MDLIKELNKERLEAEVTPRQGGRHGPGAREGQGRLP